MGRNHSLNRGVRWSVGGLNYQFITTLQTNTTYVTADGFPILHGSAVSLKLSGDLLASTAKATGSTLEALPTDPPTPPIADVRQTLRVKAPLQLQFIPEPLYAGYSESSPELPKKYAQLLHAWASVPGVIYNAGFFMPAPCFNESDQGYDAAPSLITGTLAESRMPDADWPYSACIVTIPSVQYGARRFIVLVDASSTFYCWPTVYENTEHEYLYPVDSPYIPQAIKTNVAAAITQSVAPPFPSWVHVPVGQRRDTDWPAGVNSGEPRYGWKFHPLGTHVVGTVLSRTAFAGTVKGRTTATLDYLPFTEVDIAPLKINSSRLGNLRGSTQTYSGDIQIDRPGWVEFALDISITGPNVEDFSFGLTLTRQQQADATHYPIAADYLSPVLDGWGTYGIAGTPGDLVVLDLASYIDARGLTWIARNGGYLGDTAYKVRQTWGIVRNIDAEDAELLTFLIKDQPPDFDTGRFQLTAPSMKACTGRFVHIDLARLSFVFFAKLAKYSVDASNYANGYTNRNPTTGTVTFGCRQRWEESETGVRYFVFGRKVHEERNGNNFGLWSKIDGLSLDVTASRVSPLATGTKWLTYSSAVSHRRHWLLADLEAPAVADVMTLKDRVQPSGYVLDGDTVLIRDNIVLRALSRLSNSSSGTAYHDGETSSGSGSISFSMTVRLLIAPNVYEAHPGTPCNFTWDNFIPSYQYDVQYTNIDSELAVGCSAIDSAYVAVLTDWFAEKYHTFLSHITEPVPLTYTGQYSIYLQSGNHLSGGDPIFTYDGNPWEGYLHSAAVGGAGGGVVAYSDPDFNVVSVSESGPQFTIVTGLNYSFLAGYGNSATNKFHRSMMDLLYKDEPIFYSYYDYLLETYYATNRHHRVHAYPIGAEWMLTEWVAAIEIDANFSLAACPDGFYAGHVWLPSLTGKIAAHTLLVDPTYDHEPYFLPTSDAYVAYFLIPATHVIKSDVIPCLNQLDQFYVTTNTPLVSQMTMTDIDLIGHVNGGKTSHANAYQQAYQQALDIEDPTVRVRANTDFGYVYEKGVNYNGGMVWSDFMDKITIFNAPRKNGAMLFSK